MCLKRIICFLSLVFLQSGSVFYLSFLFLLLCFKRIVLRLMHCFTVFLLFVLIENYIRFTIVDQKIRTLSLNEVIRI
jgi:hypothetical protein